MLLVQQLCYAQPRDVYTTTSGGSWVNALNWDLGSAPDNDQTDGGDDIIITHYITLTDDLTVKSGTTILVEGCDTLYVTGNVAFNNGSAITVEPCAFLIIDGNLTNNNNSTDVVINGTIIIGGNYDGGVGSELGGTGEMEIEGSVTTDGGATVFGSTTDCDSVTEDCDNSNDDPLGDPLPIELISFDGEFDGDKIILEWLVASEINNSHYEMLQIYENGEIEIIGKINGAGTINNFKQYSFIVNNPKAGVNYFQLRQVDFNGDFKEYNIISVDVVYYKINKGVELFPNPTTQGDVNLELIGFKGETVLVIMLDVNGRIFYEKVFIVEKEGLIIGIESEIPKGMYLVVGSSKQKLYRKKLIIE